MVDGVVEFPAYGDAMVPVNFVVDTGCPRTVLGPMQAAELGNVVGMNADRLGAATFMTGISGAASARNIRVRLTLLRTDDTPWTRQMDVVVLPESEDVDRSVPSLLGTDVMRYMEICVNIPDHAVVLYD
jgi:hypothetical protein